MEAPAIDEADQSDDGDGDGDGDGVYIPTLEEAQEESLTSQIAQAPSQNINYLSYADLEKNSVATMPFMSTDSGIDIKLLTDVLSPPDRIVEPDEVWEFESLWYTITGQLEDEREKDKTGAGGASTDSKSSLFLSFSASASFFGVRMCCILLHGVPFCACSPPPLSPLSPSPSALMNALVRCTLLVLFNHSRPN
jgi:hypothetical protein